MPKLPQVAVIACGGFLKTKRVMKIEIRIGDTSSNVRMKYSFEKYDDINKEKLRMYKFLSDCNNCIVEDVDNFLLYLLNNGLMAFIIKNNPELKNEAYKEEICNLIPKFDFKTYKVFEIKNDGSEISLQTESGNISKNYFNGLMGSIMDDYYSCLNFYEPYSEKEI